MNKKYKFVRQFLLIVIIINFVSILSKIPMLLDQKGYGIIAVNLGYSFTALAMSMMTFYDRWIDYRITLY